jgi:hypothetical protein
VFVHIAERRRARGDSAAAQKEDDRNLVARTLPNSRFIIAFLRGGEVLDSGERAVKVARLMLAGTDGLQGGDQLVVREDRGGRTRQTSAFDFAAAAN